MMQWDLTRSSLGDSPKGSGSSLGTRREIAERRPEDSSQECRRLLDWREINYDFEKAIQSDVVPESRSGIGPGFGRCSGSSLRVRRKMIKSLREFTGGMPRSSPGVWKID
ncbi:hypothetical protein BHM03_00034244 [Ensete ventricosum]|nr:hypothetical protein BHM03_00034244 [Ensete ventricosum]